MIPNEWMVRAGLLPLDNLSRDLHSLLSGIEEESSVHGKA